MVKESSLTARQQFWVEHLRACAARGQSLSVYAAEKDLSIGALYEVKSRLRLGSRKDNRAVRRNRGYRGSWRLNSNGVSRRARREWRPVTREFHGTVAPSSR